MSTHCLIAKKTDAGFLAIYCHHDGYLAVVGKTLALYHDTVEKVDALLALGDLSSVGVTLEPGYTVSYSRDRDEPLADNAPKEYHSLFNLRNAARAVDAEFLYVFADGVWSYLDPSRDDLTLLEVPK
jgi:hypothetical protein